MFGRVRALAVKEFLALLRDKRSRFVVIGPPIIQILVFGYAATFNLHRVPYAVYNQDPGPASRAFLSRFRAAATFHQAFTVTLHGQVAPLLDDGRVLFVLHLGPRFTRDLLRHRPAPVQVLVDGRNSNTAALALNDIEAIARAFDRSWMRTHGWGPPSSRLVVHAWYNPDLLSHWFIVPGIVALLTLVVTLLVTGLSVAREREQGTFDQLLVTPLGAAEILIGKALPGIALGLLEGGFITAMAVVWFRVPFTGSPAALALGLFLFLLAAVGLGLMVSSLARTQQQGLLGAFLILVPSIVLSGFATPIANMPRPVRLLTRLNPMRYFLVIVRGTFLEGDGVRALADQYWPLLAIALVTMALATWLFRRRSY